MKSRQSRIVWFGGQGSSHLFSKGTTSALQDARSSSTAALLLGRCFEALELELEVLGSEFEAVFESGAPRFETPEDMLRLQETFHDNALFQSTHTFLQHSLRYLATWSKTQQTFQDFQASLVETSGLCTGLLASLTIATSDSASSFIQRGVQAFRLAFWIGYRAAEFCKERAGHDFARTGWNLLLTDQNEQDLKTLLREENQLAKIKVQIAARLDDNVYSISGPPNHLERVADCAQGRSFFTSIHGMYHGGFDLTPALSEVIGDVDRRRISFPSPQEFICPIRTTSSGTCIGIETGSQTSKQTILKLFIEQILVEPANWPQLVRNTVREFEHELDRPEPMIQCFGSTMSSLLGHLRKAKLDKKFIVSDCSKIIHTPSTCTENKTNDIAIVGMGLDLPRGENPEKFWDMISKGVSALREIPDTRFELEEYQQDKSRKESNRPPAASYGYFLDDIATFDASFFNISPREAKCMDPQQRILLQTAKEALENAGYVPSSTKSFQPDSMGCFVGGATGDYESNLRNNIDVYYSTGTLRAFLSGKISYTFNLSGPSMVSDTACSSSLVSVYQACRSLQAGDCTAAIAGGVNTISAPEMFTGLDRAHFLSPSGVCKPFDADADGYGRAEGCVMFVLKRLSDALSESDRILGVIKGVEVNQSALAQSITHPHQGSQSLLMRTVLSKAELTPSSIDVVEAHGTGTQAGDSTEIGSIFQVFDGARGQEDPVFVSSVKGNVGHSEAASGAAGLAKLLLMMRHQEIVPQASFSRLNPRLSEMIGGALAIPQQLQEWKPHGTRRRALLNNFGASGSNCTLILEEPPTRPNFDSQISKRQYYPVVLSARGPEAMERLIGETIKFVSEKGNIMELADLSYSACARRQQHEYQVGLTCESREDLLKQLQNSPTFRRIPKKMQSQPVLFTFSGQGSFYFGMGGTDFIRSVPVVASIVDYCDNVLKSYGINIFKYFDASPFDEDITNVEHIAGSQCACVALEFALAKALMSWGLMPSTVIGHSLGEYTALAIAGALSIEDVLRVLVQRASMMQKQCQPGASGMLAVHKSPPSVGKVLSEVFRDSTLSIACLNSPSDCVVSGGIQDLKEFQKFCKSSDIKCTALNVPFAFHSAFMAPVSQPLEELCAKLKFHEPHIAVFSNTTGRRVGLKDFDAGYFSRHIRWPVEFVAEISEVERQDDFSRGLVVDVGPHPTTLGLVRQSLSKNSDTIFLYTLQKTHASWRSLSNMLVDLSASGYHLDWRSVFDGSDQLFYPLPSHPLIKTRHFVPYRKEHKAVDAGVDKRHNTGYELLPWRTDHSNSTQSAEFATNFQILSKFITGHSVGGKGICPASVFYEVALVAITCFQGEQTDVNFEIHDLQFLTPLIYKEEDELIEIRASVVATDSSSFRIVIKSFPTGNPDGIQNFQAVALRSEASNWQKACRKTAAVVNRQSAHVLDARADKLNVFTKSLLYENVFARVVQYSPIYQSIYRMSVLPTTLQGIGSFKLDHEALASSFIVPPTFTDTLLHAAGFIANVSVRYTDICICAKVDSIRTSKDVKNYSEQFQVYCSLFELEKNLFVADSYAMNQTGCIVAAVEGMQFKKLNVDLFRRHLATASDESESSNWQNSSAQEGKGLDEPTVERKSVPAHHVEDEELSPSRTVVERKVSQAVMDACALDAVDPSTELGHIGVDSLIIIELTSAIKKEFSDLDFADFEIDASQNLDTLIEKILHIAADPSANTDATINSPQITAISEPDATQEFLDRGASTITTSADSERVEKLLANVCGVTFNSLTEDTQLGSLGVDSILSIELGDALRNDWGLPVTTEDVQSCPTVGDLKALGLPSKIQANNHQAPPPRGSRDENDQSSHTTVSDLKAHDSPSRPQVNGYKSSPPQKSQIQNDHRPLPTISDLKAHDPPSNSQVNGYQPSTPQNKQTQSGHSSTLTVNDLKVDDLPSKAEVNGHQPLLQQNAETLHNHSSTPFGDSNPPDPPAKLQTNGYHSPPSQAIQNQINQSRPTDGDLKALGPPSKPQVNGHQPSSPQINRDRPVQNIEHFPLIIQKSQSGACPLILIHDGSGLTTSFSRLGEMGRDVAGIFSPHFADPTKIPSTIEAMATEYLSCMKRSHDLTLSKGAIFAGWSFGGVVAFMMAHIAPEYDIQANGLILIDTPFPVNHQALPDSITSYVSGKYAPTTEYGRIQQERLQAQFQANANMLEYFDPPRSGLACQVLMLRNSESFDSLGLCGVKYPWLANLEARNTALQQWKDLVKQKDAEVLNIPGNHFEVFLPKNVELTTSQVRRACDIIDKGKTNKSEEPLPVDSYEVSYGFI